MCDYQICDGHGICDIIGCHRSCVVEEQGTDWYTCLCYKHAEMLSNGCDRGFKVRNDQLLRKNHHETDTSHDEDSDEDEDSDDEEEEEEEEDDENEL